jgi:hypothetical protein
MTLVDQYGAINPMNDCETPKIAADVEPHAYRDRPGIGYDRISMSTSRPPSRATVVRTTVLLNAANSLANAG